MENEKSPYNVAIIIGILALALLLSSWLGVPSPRVTAPIAPPTVAEQSPPTLVTTPIAPVVIEQLPPPAPVVIQPPLAPPTVVEQSPPLVEEPPALTPLPSTKSGAAVGAAPSAPPPAPRVEVVKKVRRIKSIEQFRKEAEELDLGE